MEILRTPMKTTLAAREDKMSSVYVAYLRKSFHLTIVAKNKSLKKKPLLQTCTANHPSGNIKQSHNRLSISRNDE